MDLKKFVELALQEKGFDGLWSNQGCACKIGNLMPCDEPQPECEPGELAECDGTCEDGKCDFHIIPEKNS